MKIRFEYNYNIEFLFRTHSELSIKGSGIWDVDEESFAYEFFKDDKTIEEYCLKYFDDEQLLSDLNDNSIKFNPEDLKQLENFCNSYKDEFVY